MPLGEVTLTRDPEGEAMSGIWRQRVLGICKCKVTEAGRGVAGAWRGKG